MKEVKVDNLTFICDSEIENWRVKTFHEKEKGTVKWLQSEVREGDIFYDIGANIGLYTILAASLGAEVYAFEPHIMNATSLFRNIEANNFYNKIHVNTTPLHSKEALFPFNYISMKAGSSGHQLGHTYDEQGKTFTPVLSELKLSTSIDNLISLSIKPATLIKIDVDGNEKHILQGMSNLLTKNPPRNIQVEIHPQVKEGIFSLMKSHGYPISAAGRHNTMHGKDLIRQGMDPEKIAYNVIFRRS